MIVVTDKKSGAKLMDRINGPGNVIVLYYADWCGHCVRFKPEWARFKKIMAAKNQGCEVAEVEQSHISHVPVANVQGFPTIKFYRPVDAPATGLANVPGFNFFAKLMGRAQAQQQGGNNEVPFEQERNIKNLIQFVKDNRYIPGPETKNTAVKLAELKSTPNPTKLTARHKTSHKKSKGGKQKKHTSAKTQKAKRKVAGSADRRSELSPEIRNSPEYKSESKKYKKNKSQDRSVIADTIKAVFG